MNKHSNFQIKKGLLGLIILSMFTHGCINSDKKENGEKDPFTVKIITLAPGHFHAALLQKLMYDEVDSTVHVFAPT
jgi:hypothetical protein